MKKMANSLRLILVTIIITIPSILIAQTGGEEEQNDANLPFDGGVSLLVAAGIGYGLKKVHDRKKTEKYKGI
jgi:hypothetical protein